MDSLLLPLFVIACIVVAAVVFFSIISGRHLTREALTAYVSVLGALFVFGLVVAICVTMFSA